MVGTQAFMAPEIFYPEPYLASGTDLFSASIILYVMLKMQLPFSQASPHDDAYNLIANNVFEKFWEGKQVDEWEMCFFSVMWMLRPEY